MKKATSAEINALYNTGWGSKLACKRILDHNHAVDEYDRVNLLMNDLRADIKEYKEKYPGNDDNGIVKITEVLDYLMDRFEIKKVEIKNGSTC